ncbi:hypothetical protein [Nostoc sp. 'Peltigera membranacea cyanobiont' 210A]|nr:hypothetical protein [Nostoc sp. 'Peltigera membranacea cyanobiont' 210A]
MAIKNRSDRFNFSLSKSFVSLPIVVRAIAQKKDGISLNSVSRLYQ